MDDVETIGNLVEAAAWVLVALGLAVKAWRSPGRMRRFFVVMAVAFFVFGMSDVIESQTGAWWRPLWLLAMKGTCIAVFVLGFRWYYVSSKK